MQPISTSRAWSHGVRRCWRASGLLDVVMFHGRHDHEFMPHSHDVVTVILVTDGAVHIDIDGVGYDVGAGELVVIGAHQVHAARPAHARGWEMRSLHLPENLIAGMPSMPADERREIRFSNPVTAARDAAPAAFLE